jgi:hypothetical protein
MSSAKSSARPLFSPRRTETTDAASHGPRSVSDRRRHPHAEGNDSAPSENIKAEGAEVTIEELNYDDCVRMAAAKRLRKKRSTALSFRTPLGKAMRIFRHGSCRDTEPWRARPPISSAAVRHISLYRLASGLSRGAVTDISSTATKKIRRRSS